MNIIGRKKVESLLEVKWFWVFDKPVFAPLRDTDRQVKFFLSVIREIKQREFTIIASGGFEFFS